ncbi:hypothetical protein PUN28_006472 [Cardiocondyla obscurior]|uniref:Uncharacterized protein n=1 Tax=Cardiocondyla obscurior TaxID=286306 RepID=A0AAW2G9E0_9HYME
MIFRAVSDSPELFSAEALCEINSRQIREIRIFFFFNVQSVIVFNYLPHDNIHTSAIFHLNSNDLFLYNFYTILLEIIITAHYGKQTCVRIDLFQKTAAEA